MEETTGTVVLIIYVIFGILQIILLAKIWIMTNNVKKISDSRILDMISDAKLAYLEGNQPDAKKLLDEAFMLSLIDAKSGSFHTYTELYLPVVEKFKKLYDRLGLDAPDFDKYKDSESIP